MPAWCCLIEDSFRGEPVRALANTDAGSGTIRHWRVSGRVFGKDEACLPNLPSPTRWVPEDCAPPERPKKLLALTVLVSQTLPQKCQEHTETQSIPSSTVSLFSLRVHGAFVVKSKIGRIPQKPWLTRNEDRL
jgi:hypothetical protein